LPVKLDIKNGERYGRLVVIEESERKRGRRHFLCQCDCGKKSIVEMSKLKNGHTKSCGCYALESVKKRSVTHGCFGQPLYGVWNSMKQRCFNKNVSSYSGYGGRGITVCGEWIEFEPFQKWAINNGYETKLTLDRIDNDGNYEPSNCRWVAHRIQANNRSSNHFLTYNKKTMTIAEWSREVGINQLALAKRLKRGWSIERALRTPLGIGNV